MSIAMPSGQEDIYTKELKDVMAVEEDDQLFEILVGEYRVIARLRDPCPSKSE